LSGIEPPPVLSMTACGGCPDGVGVDVGVRPVVTVDVGEPDLLDVAEPDAVAVCDRVLDCEAVNEDEPIQNPEYGVEPENDDSEPNFDEAGVEGGLPFYNYDTYLSIKLNMAISTEVG
jgi:hypothetical protein